MGTVTAWHAAILAWSWKCAKWTKVRAIWIPTEQYFWKVDKTFLEVGKLCFYSFEALLAEVWIIILSLFSEKAACKYFMWEFWYMRWIDFKYELVHQVQGRLSDWAGSPWQLRWYLLSCENQNFWKQPLLLRNLTVLAVNEMTVSQQVQSVTVRVSSDQVTEQSSRCKLSVG